MDEIFSWLEMTGLVSIQHNDGKYDISVSHAGWEYFLVDNDRAGVPYNTMRGRMRSQYLMLYGNTCL